MVRWAEVANNRVAEVQNQEPGAESGSGQGQYQASTASTRKSGKRQGQVTSWSQQQGFRNKQSQEARSGYTSKHRISSLAEGADSHSAILQSPAMLKIGHWAPKSIQMDMLMSMLMLTRTYMCRCS